MAENPIDKKIGSAWKSHRQGFQDQAITEFREILHQDPNHLDALYGLGLAQKASGDGDAAHQTFNKLQQLLNSILEEEQELPLEDRQERYVMIAQMVRQQIDTL